MTKDEFNKIYDSIRKPVNKESLKEFRSFKKKLTNKHRSDSNHFVSLFEMMIEMQNKKLDIRSKALRKILCKLFISSSQNQS